MFCEKKRFVRFASAVPAEAALEAAGFRMDKDTVGSWLLGSWLAPRELAPRELETQAWKRSSVVTRDRNESKSGLASPIFLKCQIRF